MQPNPVVHFELPYRDRERAARFYTEFWRCTSCGKVFWQGSHYQRMARLIEETQQ